MVRPAGFVVCTARWPPRRQFDLPFLLIEAPLGCAFMPNVPQRPCTAPGCDALTNHGRCDKHRSQLRKEQDEHRGNAYQRGYGPRWQKASKAFLRVHPLCQCHDCREGQLRITIATVVDHIIPHRGDMALFWDNTNWQSMSKPCHDQKTAREDGGFGRPRPAP